MFSVFKFSTLTMGIDHLWCFLRIDFDVRRENNLVVGVYGVFGLVSYRNNNIEVALLCLY